MSLPALGNKDYFPLLPDFDTHITIPLWGSGLFLCKDMDLLGDREEYVHKFTDRLIRAYTSPYGEYIPYTNELILVLPLGLP